MLFSIISSFIFLLFFSLSTSSEEISDAKLYEKPYENSELKSGSYFSRKETL